jgi:two-component system NtrC family sensor kinase
MSGTAGQVTDQVRYRAGAPERKLLALDALSNLTKQFCERPDFEQLIDVLLMTLCGQFSTADSFALLKKPSAQSLNKSFFATGRFRRDILIASLPIEAEDWGRALAERRVRHIEEFDIVDDTTDQIGFLARIGVSLLCPLVQSEKFFGIVGLGLRVTGTPYTGADTDLLNTVIHAVTPLVANSYLFWDIANLSAWYLDILNNVKQGVFVFDQGLRLRNINSAGLGILRAFRDDDPGPEAVHGKPIDEVFPEPAFDGWARKFIEAGGDCRSAAGSSVVARGEGNERIYRLSVSGSVNNRDIGTALIITLDDVTLQKEGEQHLFDLQKLADNAVMTSSISHELNNFLALILGGVELAEFAIESGNTRKATATLAKLKGNIANMERFTRGLMDFAVPDSAKQTGSLKTIVDDVLSFLSVQKGFKAIKIVSEMPDDLPDFLMAPDQIAQLMLNMLNNAADAIREAGVEEGRITIEARLIDDLVELRILDNGNGIQPEVADKLFKSRLTTKAGGHGYGLVTCWNIVGDHNGTIDVSSELGKGSTFTIKFPIRA